MKRLNKLFVCIFFLFTFSCYSYDFTHTEFDFNPNVSFIDGENIIKLKLTKTGCYYSQKEVSRNFSYIIEINNRINATSVYLCMLDSEGFQLRDPLFISHVCDGFVGTLKGNVSISLREDEKICGAQLRYFSENKKPDQINLNIISN